MSDDLTPEETRALVDRILGVRRDTGFHFSEVGAIIADLRARGELAEEDAAQEALDAKAAEEAEARARAEEAEAMRRFDPAMGMQERDEANGISHDIEDGYANYVNAVLGGS